MVQPDVVSTASSRSMIQLATPCLTSHLVVNYDNLSVEDESSHVHNLDTIIG